MQTSLILRLQYLWLLDMNTVFWIVYFSFTWQLFDPKLEKTKKLHPDKKPLLFCKMEISSSNIKKFLIFSYISGNENHKKILYILGNRKRSSKKLLIFQEMELLSRRSKNKRNLSRKKFLIFQEIEPSGSNIKKFLYCLKRNVFLYFRKWNPAIFKPRLKK